MKGSMPVHQSQYNQGVHYFWGSPIGALLWTVTFVGMGYSLGGRGQQVLASLERHRLIVVAVAVVALAAYLAARGTNRRK
jgi:membrane protein DedA with SNARE-associated domain